MISGDFNCWKYFTIVFLDGIKSCEVIRLAGRCVIAVGVWTHTLDLKQVVIHFASLPCDDQRISSELQINCNYCGLWKHQLRNSSLLTVFINNFQLNFMLFDSRYFGTYIYTFITSQQPESWIIRNEKIYTGEKLFLWSLFCRIIVNVLIRFICCCSSSVTYNC